MTKRLTPGRKLFVSLVEEMEEFFDDGKFKNECMSDFQFLIRRVVNNAPKSIKDKLPWIVGSALWYCLLERGFDFSIEDCSETCRGGEVFGAAMQVFRELGVLETILNAPD